MAVDGVSLSVHAGACVGVVGESGSGKSTLARLLLRLEDASSGSVTLVGKDITHARGHELRAVYRQVQAVFQNPMQSFDPRSTLGASIEEPLHVRGVSRREARERARQMLERCGLAPELAQRYPREVSGGQCQHAAIARALMTGPSLLVCDEATSALDVTVQAQIVALLQGIQRQSGMALLFITHDIALASQICDELLVMRAGRIVERGPTADLIAHPQDAYTHVLIDAVP